MKCAAILLLAATAACAADMLEIFDRKWQVPVAADWKIERQDGAPVLRLDKSRGPAPGPRRPQQFALADVAGYGRITLEADVKPLDRSLMLVFSYRDEAHFDYAHLSTDTGMKQPVHNGIFHVFGGERVRISSQSGPASFVASERWYRVKLTHTAATGTVSVTVDGEAVPALNAVDLSLGAGKVGLGSFDERAEFKNVRILVE
jgi:hypothetical protein